MDIDYLFDTAFGQGIDFIFNGLTYIYSLLRSVTLYGGVTLFGVFFGTVSVAIIAGHLIPFLSPQERAAVSKNSKDGTKLNADYVYVNGRYIRRRSY